MAEPGWGLSVSVRHKSKAGATSVAVGGITSSLVVLVAWWAGKNDVQGAAGLASVVLGAAALVLARLVV